MTDATELDLDAVRARWTPPKREDYQGPGADIAHSLALMQWSLSRGVESKTDIPALLAALDEAHRERDKAKRAAKTLGGIVEQNARMILDITGLHDWIDEDGDGDWGAVWENAYELLPKLRAAESSLAAVEALADEWEVLASRMDPRSWSGIARQDCADEIRAALAPTPPDKNPGGDSA